MREYFMLRCCQIDWHNYYKQHGDGIQYVLLHLHMVYYTVHLTSVLSEIDTHM